MQSNLSRSTAPFWQSATPVAAILLILAHNGGYRPTRRGLRLSASGVLAGLELFSAGAPEVEFWQSFQEGGSAGKADEMPANPAPPADGWRRTLRRITLGDPRQQSFYPSPFVG